VFNQPQYSPIPFEVQVATIWVVQNGGMDTVPLERVKELQKKLVEFLSTRKAELLQRIAAEKTLSPPLIAELKKAADQFKETWK
jgi:F-type H+-transporting ATPase subunit alpha